MLLTVNDWGKVTSIWGSLTKRTVCFTTPLEPLHLVTYRGNIDFESNMFLLSTEIHETSLRNFLYISMYYEKWLDFIAIFYNFCKLILRCFPIYVAIQRKKLAIPIKCMNIATQ
jgi:hypothetical protein